MMLGQSFRFFLVLGGFLVYCPPQVHADLKLKEGKISSALRASPSNVKVVRGGDAEIILKSSGNYHNQVRFEILAAPAHGTLSKVRLTSDQTASLVYHHDDNVKSSSDHFTFRVLSAGRSPSSPTLCSIDVMPKPGRLVIGTDFLDFGKAIGGDGVSRKILVRNEGEVPITVRLGTLNSFLAPETSSLCLKGGESRQINILFHPSQSGYFQGDVEVSAEDGRGIRRISCRGEVLPRFDLIKGTSKTSLVFTNFSSHELRLKISEPPEWSHSDDLILPATGSATLTMRPAYGKQPAGSGGSIPLRVTDGMSTCELLIPPPVYVPLGLSWKCTIPATIHSGEEIAVSAGISNPSVYERRVSWNIETPRAEHHHADSHAIVIPPLGEMIVKKSWSVSDPGPCIITVSASENGADPQKLSWKISVADPVCIQPIVASNPVISKNQTGPAPTPEPEMLPSIPDLNVAVKSSWVGKSRVIVSWSSNVGIREAEVWHLVPGKPPDDPESLARDNRLSPEALFESLPQSFQPDTEGGKIRSLRIADLSAGNWFFRVKLIGDGDCGDFDSRFTVEIPSPDRIPWWSFLVIVALILGLIYFLWIRDRQY